MNTTELLPGKIVQLSKVFTVEECKRYIDLSEKKGYKPGNLSLHIPQSLQVPHNLIPFSATLNVGQKDVKNEDVRNNERVIMEDPELAQRLWEMYSTLSLSNFTSISFLFTLQFFTLTHSTLLLL